MYLKMVAVIYFCRIGVAIFLYFKLRNETDVEINHPLTMKTARPLSAV